MKLFFYAALLISGIFAREYQDQNEIQGYDQVYDAAYEPQANGQAYDEEYQDNDQEYDDDSARVDYYQAMRGRSLSQGSRPRSPDPILPGQANIVDLATGRNVPQNSQFNRNHVQMPRNRRPVPLAGNRNPGITTHIPPQLIHVRGTSNPRTRRTTYTGTARVATRNRIGGPRSNLYRTAPNRAYVPRNIQLQGRTGGAIDHFHA